MKVLNIILVLTIVIILFLIFYDDRISLSEFERDGKNKSLSFYVAPSILDENFKEKAINILLQSGWNKKYNLKPVNNMNEAFISIYQVPTQTLEKFTDKSDNNIDSDGRKMNYSLCSQSRWDKPVILIDADNWEYGVKRSGLTLEQYREYVITHEFGHALSFDHVKCNKDTIGEDGRCPVMNQSTRGCKEFLCGYQVNQSDFKNKIYGSYFK